jgi:hypothetical protein
VPTAISPRLSRIDAQLTAPTQVPAVENREAREVPLRLSARLVPTGDARWIREIFGAFALAMAIGVLSIYAVLVHPARHDPGGAAAVGGRRDRRVARVRLQPRDQLADHLADAHGHRVQETLF